MKAVHYALPFLALLAACGGKEEGGNNSSEGAGEVQESTPANLYADQQNQVVPLTTPTQPGPSPSPVASIPADYQGRWGQTFDDCMPQNRNAKGLMIVSTDGLGFFQSRAAINRMDATTPGTLKLDITFSGNDGQQWDRTETLTLLDAGKTLVREEQHPASSTRYSRCPDGKETNQ